MKICPQCLEKFEGGRSNRLYCSDACKMQAFQQRHKEETSKDFINRPESKFNNKNDSKSSKFSPEEVELRKHELDLVHQRKLLLFEQRQKEVALKEKEVEAAKRKEEEELTIAKAKKEREARQKQLEESLKKAFAPIKMATRDILLSIIENGRDSIWPVIEVEESIEEIDDTLDKLKKYHLNKHTSFRDSIIYCTLKELKGELEEVLSDEEYYENEQEVLIDFKKSYLRELQTVLQDLNNGLEYE